MFAKLKMATLSACVITILVIAIVDVRSLRLTGTTSNIAGEEGLEPVTFKRSVDFIGKSAYLGILAVKKNLVGAKKLPSTHACCEHYTKTGTFREAVRDFDIMNPDINSVFRFTNNGTGIVGDKEILVRSKGLDGKPYLEIVDTNAHRAHPKDQFDNNPPIKRIRISYRGKLGHLKDN